MSRPLLALAARGVAVLAVAQAVCAATATLLKGATVTGWYGRRAFNSWRAVTTPGGAWELAYGHVEDVVGVVAVPAGLLAAGGLLRLAATGHLRLATQPSLVRAATTPAAVGLGLALVAGGLGVARWVCPEIYSNYSITYRVRVLLDTGEPKQVDLSHVPGRTSWWAGGGGPGPATGDRERARRVALAVAWEGGRLGANVAPAVALFCLCGVVYCLGRSHPDAPGAGP